VNPHQPLIDQLYREQIAQARKLTPQQKLRAGFEATELALKMMRSAIRNRHPEADDAELIRLGRERLSKVRRIDESTRYRRVE
jgi:hypothetical protein